MIYPIEAHPTDYNGIRFRSKCEAIFYRNLQLHGWLVAYEPDHWLVDGWSFDFHVAWLMQRGAIANVLIEYKPSEPTAAYMERHEQRIRSLGKSLTGFHNVVAIGSPFNPIRKSLKFDHLTGEWTDFESTVQIFGFIDDAAKHRFDLL